MTPLRACLVRDSRSCDHNKDAFGYLFLRGRGWSDAGAPRLVACMSVGAWLPASACKRRCSAWVPGNEFGFRFLGAWLLRA